MLMFSFISMPSNSRNQTLNNYALYSSCQLSFVNAITEHSCSFEFLYTFAVSSLEELVSIFSINLLAFLLVHECSVQYAIISDWVYDRFQSWDTVWHQAGDQMSCWVTDKLTTVCRWDLAFLLLNSRHVK